METGVCSLLLTCTLPSFHVMKLHRTNNPQQRLHQHHLPRKIQRAKIHHLMLMDSYIFGGRGMRANESVFKCWDQWWQIMCRNSEFIPDPNDEAGKFFNSISYTVISSIL